MRVAISHILVRQWASKPIGDAGRPVCLPVLVKYENTHDYKDGKPINDEG